MDSQPKRQAMVPSSKTVPREEALAAAAGSPDPALPAAGGAADAVVPPTSAMGRGVAAAAAARRTAPPVVLGPRQRLATGRLAVAERATRVPRCSWFPGQGLEASPAPLAMARSPVAALAEAVTGPLRAAAPLAPPPTGHQLAQARLRRRSRRQWRRLLPRQLRSDTVPFNQWVGGRCHVRTHVWRHGYKTAETCGIQQLMKM